MATVKQKQRRTSFSDGEPQEGGISTKQALIYVGIVITCFGVIYPRMLHPMVKNALGFGDSPQTQPKDDLPPQIKNRGRPIPGSPPGMGRPPPGARGDASTEATKGSSGGGMMTMILPVYAFGIILYLMYTASKVYGGGDSEGGKSRRKKKKNATDEVYSMITERLAGLDLEKVLNGEDSQGAEEINKLAGFLKKRNDGDRPDNWMDDMDDSDLEGVEEVIPSYQETKQPRRENTKIKRSPDITEKIEVNHEDDTQELLRKCENHEHMTPEEMIRLQKRLLEVEGRMNSLMSAINTVKDQTNTVAAGILAEEAETYRDNMAPPLNSSQSGDVASNEDQPSANSKQSSASTAIESLTKQEEDNSSCDDVTGELSSQCDSVNESEVEEIYGGIDSDDEMIGGYPAGDTEMGGVRKRHAFNQYDDDDLSSDNEI